MNLKITFDGSSDDIAFVNHPGCKRPRKVKGRWIVFLRDRPCAGIFPEDIVFSAPTTRECHDFIDTQRRN